MADQEPKRKNPINATGKTVAANVKRLREGQNLAFTELAAILDKLGKPIPTLGLRHIEAEKRRVDSDDLVALAAALNVSPVTLLMPVTNDPIDEVAVTSRGHTLPAYVLWNWLIGEADLDYRDGDDQVRGPMFYQRQARPEWVPLTSVGRLRSVEGTDMTQIDDRVRESAKWAVKAELQRADPARSERIKQLFEHGTQPSSDGSHGDD